MATPEFVLRLREAVGHEQLWMPGCTAVVLRPSPQAPQCIQDTYWTCAQASHDSRTVGSRFPAGPLDPAHWEVLTVRRADNGAWTPVTGIIDPGEEAAWAAIREVHEETGIHTLPVRLLSTEVVGPMTYPNGDEAIYLDLAFLMAVECCDRDAQPWPADGENSQCTFVRVDACPAMNQRFQRVVERALSGAPDAVFSFEGTYGIG